MEVTKQEYKTLKLRHMRLWRETLKKQGIRTTDEELHQMWKKFDSYTVIEKPAKIEVNWEEVRRIKALTELQKYVIKKPKKITFKKEDTKFTQLYSNGKPNAGGLKKKSKKNKSKTTNSSKKITKNNI